MKKVKTSQKKYFRNNDHSNYEDLEINTLKYNLYVHQKTYMKNIEYADEERNNIERTKYAKNILKVIEGNAIQGKLDFGSIIGLTGIYGILSIVNPSIKNDISVAFHDMMLPKVQKLADSNPKYKAFYEKCLGKSSFGREDGSYRMPYTPETAAMDELALEMDYYNKFRISGLSFDDKKALKNDYEEKRMTLQRLFERDGIDDKDICAANQKIVTNLIKNDASMRKIFAFSDSEMDIKEIDRQAVQKYAYKTINGTEVPISVWDMPKEGYKFEDGTKYGGRFHLRTIPQTKEYYEELFYKTTQPVYTDLKIKEANPKYKLPDEAKEAIIHGKEILSAMQADGFSEEEIIHMRNKVGSKCEKNFREENTYTNVSVDDSKAKEDTSTEKTFYANQEQSANTSKNNHNEKTSSDFNTIIRNNTEFDIDKLTSEEIKANHILFNKYIAKDSGVSYANMLSRTFIKLYDVSDSQTKEKLMNYIKDDFNKFDKINQEKIGSVFESINKHTLCCMFVTQMKKGDICSVINHVGSYLSECYSDNIEADNDIKDSIRNGIIIASLAGKINPFYPVVTNIRNEKRMIATSTYNKVAHVGEIGAKVENCTFDVDNSYSCIWADNKSHLKNTTISSYFSMYKMQSDNTYSVKSPFPETTPLYISNSSIIDSKIKGVGCICNTSINNCSMNGSYNPVDMRKKEVNDLSRNVFIKDRLYLNDINSKTYIAKVYGMFGRMKKDLINWMDEKQEYSSEGFTKKTYSKVSYDKINSSTKAYKEQMKKRTEKEAYFDEYQLKAFKKAASTKGKEDDEFVENLTEKLDKEACNNSSQVQDVISKANKGLQKESHKSDKDMQIIS